jgi:hypothetical protein
LCAVPGRSAVISLSLTGTLPTSAEVFQQSFMLTGKTSIGISTWSFW